MILSKILQQILLFFYGILDSIRLKRVAEYFVLSKKIRKLFSYCFLMNSVIFLGWILFYEYFIKFFLMKSEFLNKIHWIFDLFFFVILIFAYLISFLLSTFWFSDISTEAILIEKKLFENKNFYKKELDLATKLTNEVYIIFLKKI